jgi:hypothetical protein
MRRGTYRLYIEEGLTVRTKYRNRAASRSRVPQGLATASKQRWSMDFVSDRFVDDRWFRMLTVVDQFTRECLLLYVRQNPQLSSGTVLRGGSQVNSLTLHRYKNPGHVICHAALSRQPQNVLATVATQLRFLSRSAEWSNPFHLYQKIKQTD